MCGDIAPQSPQLQLEDGESSSMCDFCAEAGEQVRYGAVIGVGRISKRGISTVLVTEPAGTVCTRTSFACDSQVGLISTALSTVVYGSGTGRRRSSRSKFTRTFRSISRRHSAG